MITAFDEQLAMRSRYILREHAGIVERRMFGGIAFKLNDMMFGGIVGEELIVRLGTQVALDDPCLRPMDFTGRPLKGIFFVSAAGVKTDERLRKWLDQAMLFVTTLPRNKRRGSVEENDLRRRSRVCANSTADPQAS